MRQSAILLAVLALFTAVPAAAQDQFHVRALGGVTFGGDAGPFFGAGGGYRVYKGLSWTVELGYMPNVLPGDRQDDLDDALDLIEIISPVDVEVDVDQSAFYGISGLRYDFFDDRFRPYVEGGLGFASVSTEVSGSVGGFELPAFVERQLDFSEDSTEFMSSIGAGVAIDLGDSAGLDIGYRYDRIFTEDAIDVHKVYGALRFGF
jgi:opacity protein-like surface antigen